MLDIGNFRQGLKAGAPACRTVASLTHDFDHETTLAVNGGSHRGFTAGKSVVGIGEAGKVLGGALSVAQGDRSGFGAELCLNQLLEFFRCSREGGMAECV